VCRWSPLDPERYVPSSHEPDGPHVGTRSRTRLCGPIGMKLASHQVRADRSTVDRDHRLADCLLKARYGMEIRVAVTVARSCRAHERTTHAGVGHQTTQADTWNPDP
jgi:hypothetical protein